MKKLSVLLMLMLGFVLVDSGCKKKQSADNNAGPQINGVPVNLPKLRESLSTAPADVQRVQTDMAMAIRYGDLPRAEATLSATLSNPALTEDQKKVINEVLEQLKKAEAAKPAAPPAQ